MAADPPRGLPFADPWDERLAHQGPGAIFTVDHKGQLRLAPDRTRDALGRVDGEAPQGWCHCLYTDRATRWVQYVLATSPALCREHPRAEIEVFDSQEAALAALAALGRPPLR